MTTTSAARLDEAADRLASSAASGTPCPPVRDLIDRDDVDAAYAVQERLTERRLAAGARVVGRKIGLTSRAVQAQLGVDQPDLGILFDDMAYGHGDTIDIGRLQQPRAEAEIAFVLSQDLNEGNLDLDQVRNAVDYAIAALEICDSRIAGWDISLADTVADNASAGLYVLGTQRRDLSSFEPRDVDMYMVATGQDDSTGTGADCLGDPLLALQWLARTARDFGAPLLAGQVVLSGALGPMRPVAAGSEVSASITGLGTVSVRFNDRTTS